MKNKIAIYAILANIVLAVGKVTVGFISNSASIMAEGIHSSVDVISSFIGWIGVTLGKKPVDKKHPYGHYKFEVMAGTIITIILFITGIEIVIEAYKSFLNPKIITIGFLALGTMLFSAIVNEVMARVKIYYGKKENAVALVSDGIHSRVDVWASLVVLFGLFFSPYWIYIDSLMALFVGLYVIKESLSLGKEMTDSLLDTSASSEIEEEIKGIIKKQNIKLVNLKTQKKGLFITANVKIALSEHLKMKEATIITNKLKEILLSEIDPLEYVVIQIESDKETRSESYYRSKGMFGRNRIHWTSSQIKNDSNNICDFCYCPACGYKKKHERGVPCATLKCLNCDTTLQREVLK